MTKFIDTKEYAQHFPKSFTFNMELGGWENFLTYRARSGYKFADVRLYRSLGSDGQMRHLGMAFGYDTQKSQFADRRIITEGTPLGLLHEVDDGDGKTFETQVRPLDEEFGVQVFINGQMVRDKDYTIDYHSGVVKFKNVVPDGNYVTANFKLSLDAPESPPYLVFFTFNAVHMNQMVGDDAPIKIADGDGIKKDYSLPTKPIRLGTLHVYVDGVQLKEPDDYEADYTNGIVKFKEAPKLGKEITVKYEHLIAGMTRVRAEDGDGKNKVFYAPVTPIGTKGAKVYVNGVLQKESDVTVDYNEGKFTLASAPPLGAEVTLEFLDLTGGYPSGSTTVENDITIPKGFDPTKPDSLMAAVYSSLDYIVPSLPTVLDFTSEKEFGGAWQRDSYIYLWGNINRDRAMLFTRPDPTGDPETALFAPLYFGRIRGLSLNPRINMALASGCSPAREIKYKKGLKIADMPMDFGQHTSNGNRGVSLSQGLGGAYYQSLYLKFFTYSKYADNDDGNFNASVYSGKHHFSYLKVTHPYDGDVGWLDDVLAIHPKNIYNDNEVEIEKKIEGELLGHGDPMRRIYHLRHEPFENKFQIFVGCELIDVKDYTYDEETKALRFKESQPMGAEITATYEISHKYRYNLPTTPITSWRLEQYSPYWPIGIGVLVDGQKPKREVTPPEEKED